MNKKQTETRTREIYHKQHKQYLKNEIIFKRFLKLASNPKYYHLKKSDFKGMKVLDAGCGNSAYFQVAMHNLGVKHITCLDLGRKWIPELKKAIKLREIPEKIDYIHGNTDKLPFPNNNFDMVVSNGVLIHLQDMKQIKKSFKELARVTKPKGYLYMVMGVSGGLLEEEIIPSIRRYYQNNPNFKKLIDNITPKTFVNILKDITKGMKKHTKEEFNYKPLLKLFDTDFCTTIQNVLQVPNRYTLTVNKDFIFEQFNKYGFEKPKRCRRFVKRKNIRKYFAPLHYEKDNPISKLLYGQGNLEYIAKKK